MILHNTVTNHYTILFEQSVVIFKSNDCPKGYSKTIKNFYGNTKEYEIFMRGLSSVKEIDSSELPKSIIDCLTVREIARYKL